MPETPACGSGCGCGGAGQWLSVEEFLHPEPLSGGPQRRPEFPPHIAEAPIDRRTALKLMAAAGAMAAAGCSEPPDEIVPYVRMPESLVPGEPLYFATALTLSGYARPAVGETWEGRPTKLEGNALHPWGTDGTDLFLQAAVLTLYDPDRSRAVRGPGRIASWDAFLRALVERLETFGRTRGEGMRFLTGTVTSPTLADQLESVLTRFPRARWHRWSAVPRENVREGARLAFGRVLDPVWRFDRALRVFSLDSDFLGPGPEQVPNAARFSQMRRARHGTERLSRLYAAEPAMTITGAQADHRLAVRRAEVWRLAEALAAELGAPGVGAPELAEHQRQFIQAAAADLSEHAGAALVVAGEAQPPEVHALAHWMNHALQAYGSTVHLIPPVAFGAGEESESRSIAALAEDMHAGRVDTLIMIGGNPVYDAPADLDFAEALPAVPFSMRLGVYDNETSALCTWHVPMLHELEAWGDARTTDGTASVAQPLITPLFGGRSAFELLGALFGQYDVSDREAVRAHWRRAWRRADAAEDFESWWRRVLHDGFVAGSGPEPVELEEAPRLPERRAPEPGQGYEAVFLPDPSLWDGRFANNGWLQETPKPLSKEVWGNAATVSPVDAAYLGVNKGDVLRIAHEGREIGLPVIIAPGHAEGSVGLHLGYGRWRAGEVGNSVGVSVYPLRTTESLWAVPGVSLEPFPRGSHRVITTQQHYDMHHRDLVHRLTLSELAAMAASETDEEPPSLYPEYEYPTHAWAMVIDQSVCIGCNACVVACQAENNIPIVGPQEVERGRAMHWLRIDLYHHGLPEDPEMLWQPVPCMHCEKAPCEPVCPVEAAVHDSEGLNLQVYNRCVGTRFCEANCPYKVRRFNFFGYAEDHEYANLGDPLYRAVANPNVTVRTRGVMEKCTYCVQRISRARRKAKVEDREIAEGEVVTACQAACPTRAIVFGDLNESGSAVRKLKDEPHEYELLGHLGTRPRTTYLARVRAPNESLARSK